MQPNVLFLFTDQQRWDSVGVYGQRLDVTPRLDRFAGEGVRFEHAFTCQPVCGPARACLQTGRFATETGCFINGIALPQGGPTVARYLHDAGYDVAYVGKWHLASNQFEYNQRAIPPERRGGFDGYWVAADLPEYLSNGYAGKLFDQHGGEVHFEGFRPDAYTDHALRFLERGRSDRPFFLFVSYVEPHPQPYHKRYQGPDPPHRRGILRDYLRYDAPEEDLTRFDDCDVPGDLLGTEGDWPESYSRYLASCERIDYNVARLLGRLEELGLADDTLVVYTSDHACHFHTRNATDGKCSCHENSIRVPLLARGPGFTGGRVEGHMVSLIDLPPTLLEAAGVPVPEHMKGRPLQRLVRGQAGDWPDSVFVQISSAEVGRAVRTQRWKYAVTARHKHPRRDAGSDLYYESHLYDLATDPHERMNLADEPAFADVRAGLRETLVDWMEVAGEQRPQIRTPAEWPENVPPPWG